MRLSRRFGATRRHAATPRRNTARGRLFSCGADLRDRSAGATCHVRHATSVAALSHPWQVNSLRSREEHRSITGVGGRVAEAPFCGGRPSHGSNKACECTARRPSDPPRRRPDRRRRRGADFPSRRRSFPFLPVVRDGAPPEPLTCRRAEPRRVWPPRLLIHLSLTNDAIWTYAPIREVALIRLSPLSGGESPKAVTSTSHEL